jgi:hypothetical protein
MPYRKPKKKLTKPQAEALSRTNVKKIIQGTDNMKSWGKTGWYRSTRIKDETGRTFKWFHYRSTIELAVIQELDKAKNLILDYDGECFYIPYEYKGMTCNYVPDFICKTNGGTVYVIEVKPASQLKDPKNQAKWSQAKRWCWQNKAKFIVITDKDKEQLIPILTFLEDKKTKEAKALLEWQG